MVNAGVLKLVDKLDLGSSAERRMGSIPFARTITAPCDREPLSVYLKVLVEQGDGAHSVEELLEEVTLVRGVDGVPFEAEAH